MSPLTLAEPVAAVEGPCLHCGTLTEGDYCCHGCEVAADMLARAGLGRYYAERTRPAPRPVASAVAWDLVDVAVDDAGMCRADLAIDGLRCASCVWVTERLLESEPGVVEAHVSYATGRARVRWDPATTDLARVTARVATVGYRPRPLHVPASHDRDLLMRLGVAAFAAGNVMTLGAVVYGGWVTGMDAAWASLFRWMSLLLATPVALWSAAPFFTGALNGLRARTLHMDVPISLAVGALYAHGVLATAVWHVDGYLDSLTMLVTLLLAGRVLEARGRGQVSAAVYALASHLPRRATRIDGDTVTEVDPAALTAGDLVEVATGTELPADGVVVAGHSRVRMAVLTGESEPVAVGPGDAVVAGGVVDGAPIRVSITAAGDETLLARMAEALRASVDTPARHDHLAPWFTGATLVAAGVAWVVAGGGDAGLARSVAVLVVACPCALALAEPLVLAAGLGGAARRGLLLRSPDALLRLAGVRRVALDKTGTLTGGVPEVVEADDRALRLAAGLERSSQHPVARAVVKEAIRRGIALPLGEDVVEEAGVGLRGRIDGRTWTLSSGGPGRVTLRSDAGEAHTLVLRDVVRGDAVGAVEALRRLGLDPVILTGDRRGVAERIGAELGVAAHAELGPLDKKAWLEAHPDTLFVGDGLNDGPALAAAHVGLAMGTGMASAVLAADGVVSHEGVAPVVAGVRIARRARRGLEAARARAVVYNVVSVGAAMAGWVNPLVAAVLMPLSSLAVLWEAHRVGTFAERGT